MALDGVDISGYDAGIDAAGLTADFVIVKATEGLQGTRYNRGYRSMADEALNSGKLLGFYHYANGDDPVAEADSFYEAIKDYKGIAVPCLDWEGQGNHLFGSGEDVDWCKAFLDRIAARMNATPMIYTSKGVCNQWDWSSCVKYPLWGAEYAYDDYTYIGYEENPWQSNRGWGAWGSNVTIHQYGYVKPRPNDGGVGALDADKFYGSKADWQRLCGKVVEKPKQVPGNVVNNNGLNYRAHVQDMGWCEPVRDGQVAGTIGFSKRLEALKITPPKGWNLRVKMHIANVGWKTFDNINEKNGTIIGTIGQSNAVECIMIEVKEKPAGDNRKLYFKVHQENAGWKGWTPEGFASGTDGMGLRLEAIQMKIQ